MKIQRFWAHGGSRDGSKMASWPTSAHLGGILEQLAGNMADKMATCRQLGRTWAELGRPWGGLGRSWGGLEGSWASKPFRSRRKPLRCWRKPWRSDVRVDGMADATEDEVFEEEESAEVEGDPARPCHPVCDRGRRIQGLTPFRRPLLGLSSRVSCGFPGASWEPLGGISGASWGLPGGSLGGNCNK